MTTLNLLKRDKFKFPSPWWEKVCVIGQGLASYQDWFKEFVKKNWK